MIRYFVEYTLLYSPENRVIEIREVSDEAIIECGIPVGAIGYAVFEQECIKLDGKMLPRKKYYIVRTSPIPNKWSRIAKRI